VLASYVPARRLGAAFGTKASCICLGLIAGPAGGGWLAGRFNWRWIFWVEIPAAVLGIALAALAIPSDADRARWIRYDVMFGFRPWTFGAAVVSLLIAFTATYMLTFLLPFYLVNGRHQSGSTGGGCLALFACARLAMALWSGRCSDWVGPRLLAIPGLILLAVGLAALARADESSSAFVISTAVVLAGLGLGSFLPPNNSVLMASAPQEHHGFAGGIMATARTMGMAAGVVLASAILSATTGSLISRISVAFAVAALFALAAAATSLLATPLASSGSRSGRPVEICAL